MDYVAGETFARSHRVLATYRGKVIDSSDANRRSFSGKMTCVGRSWVQVQVQVTEFYEKAPLKRDFTKILSWNWYIN